MKINLKEFGTKVNDIHYMKLALFVDIENKEMVFIFKITEDVDYKYKILGNYTNDNNGVCITHTTKLDNYLFLGYVSNAIFSDVELED